jgi:hypothetical protein
MLVCGDLAMMSRVDEFRGAVADNRLDTVSPECYYQRFSRIGNNLQFEPLGNESTVM